MLEFTSTVFHHFRMSNWISCHLHTLLGRKDSISIPVNFQIETLVFWPFFLIKVFQSVLQRKELVQRWTLPTFTELLQRFIDTRVTGLCMGLGAGTIRNLGTNFLLLFFVNAGMYNFFFLQYRSIFNKISVERDRNCLREREKENHLSITFVFFSND